MDTSIKKYYSISDIIEIIDNIISTNYSNRKNKLTNKNIAVEIVGSHGLGKSMSIQEYAIENKMSFVKRELAQISDETSLYGYPRKTIKVAKIEILIDKNDPNNTEKKRRLIKKIEFDDLQRYIDDGWEQYSNDTELSYSTPEWVSELYKTEKSILFLDESRRALPHIMQATMNLINDGQYGDWKLPPGCTIILANNPDDEGDYNVGSFDLASNDRMFRYNVKADINSWVQWATNNHIKEECINFMIKVPEAHEKENSPSYRMWTNFFISLNNLNLRNKDNYDMIYRLGIGSIGENNLFMFKTFIDNNLDIIPNINEIFSKKITETEAINKLQKAIYSVNDQGVNVLRTDIKGLLGLRIKSYFRSNNISDVAVDRFVEICKSKIIPKESMLDILMDMQKNNHPNKKLINILLINPTIKDILLNTKSINI